MTIACAALRKKKRSIFIDRDVNRIVATALCVDQFEFLVRIHPVADCHSALQNFEFDKSHATNAGFSVDLHLWRHIVLVIRLVILQPARLVILRLARLVIL